MGIAEFGRILGRRWKTVLGTTALVTTLGIAAAVILPAKYTATTALLIDSRNRASFQIESSFAPTPFDPNLVDSQAILIESESVLRRVIQSEKLMMDDEFALGKGEAAANALENLKAAVKVKRPERTYVVEVQVRTKDPKKSARLANAIANAFLSDGSDAKTDTVTREQGWLDKHLKGLETRLRQAEAKVDEYRTANRIFGAEGRLVNEQQLSEINRALADAQRREAESRATLEQVETLRRSGRLPDSTSEALRSSTIERLRAQQTEILRLEANSRSTLGPRHPASIEVREQLSEVQRQITEELRRIGENARSAFTVAKANVQGLERELERLKKTSSETNHTLLGLRELERAVEAQKAVYEKFLRDKEAIARLSIETPAGRVIQVAEVPVSPSFPNRLLLILLSLVGGLFFGVGLALLMETLARAREGAQGETAAGLGGGPVAPARRVAALPGGATLIARLPGAVRRGLFGLRKEGPSVDAVLSAPSGPYAREVRALAAKLAPGLAEGPMTLMVSGVEAGQSNPVLAINLALALAQPGRAVLLVDGHGGAGSLTERLAASGAPVEIMVSGRRQLALAVPAGAAGTLYLLPFGTPASGRRAGGLPRAPAPQVTLIDGPPLRSGAFASLDVSGAIDGVLVTLPPGTKAPDRQLRRELGDRLGTALLGLVGQGT